MSKSDHHLDYEQHYFSQKNKESKKDKKLAQNKDRSKYKKTDRDKKVIPTLSALIQELPLGRVISVTSEGMLVASEEKNYICSLRGSFKQEKTKHKNLVTVGDMVRFEILDEKIGVIEAIEPRKSVLCRAENHSRHKQQLLAANIDQVFITTSPFLPSFKPTLIDRYVIMAQKGNMTPIVVINKWDLLSHPEEGASPEMIEAAKEFIELFIEGYKTLGVTVLCVSAEQGDGLEDLAKLMEGKTSVFSGQSGVGKTSLINKLSGLDLRTSDVRAQTQKGRHTTTSASLLPLAHGGYCVDTPGIKSFGLWEITLEELKDYFPDIQLFAKKCRFPDCKHIHEPDCAVIRAVEKGKLSPLRYESYLLLHEDLKENRPLF